MKKLSSIVSKLSAEKFAVLHSDWPKLLLGSQALVRGHRILKCVFNAICSHCILSICNIYLFPALVLRVGFAF